MVILWILCFDMFSYFCVSKVSMLGWNQNWFRIKLSLVCIDYISFIHQIRMDFYTKWDQENWKVHSKAPKKHLLTQWHC